MTPLASVVIPVHDDAAGLRATLEALARQTMPAGAFEVIVVDDHSGDDPAAVAALFPFARVVRNTGAAGSYSARNLGIEQSHGAIIAFTDADCVPDPGWLTAGVRALEANPGAVLAGAIRMPLGPHPTLAAMVDVIHHLDQRRCVETEGYAVTANVMTTREVIEDTGGFDATLRSSGDREFTQRAQRLGHPLVYDSDVSIVHPPRTTARAIVTKSVRVGRGSSALRASLPPTERGRPIYLRRGVVRPRHRPEGLRRLRENGAHPTPLRWKVVGLAQLVLLQFPQVGAAAAADLRLAWRRGLAATRAARARRTV